MDALEIMLGKRSIADKIAKNKKIDKDIKSIAKK